MRLLAWLLGLAMCVVVMLTDGHFEVERESRQRRSRSVVCFDKQLLWVYSKVHRTPPPPDADSQGDAWAYDARSAGVARAGTLYFHLLWVGPLLGLIGLFRRRALLVAVTAVLPWAALEYFQFAARDAFASSPGQWAEVSATPLTWSARGTWLACLLLLSIAGRRRGVALAHSLQLASWIVGMSVTFGFVFNSDTHFVFETVNVIDEVELGFREARGSNGDRPYASGSPLSMAGVVYLGSLIAVLALIVLSRWWYRSRPVVRFGLSLVTALCPLAGLLAFGYAVGHMDAALLEAVAGARGPWVSRPRWSTVAAAVVWTIGLAVSVVAEWSARGQRPGRNLDAFE